MINPAGLAVVLRVNGLNKNSTWEKVEEVLTELKYDEADKKEIFSILKTQGWFFGSVNIDSTTNSPVAAAVPVASVSPTSVPVVASSVGNYDPIPKSAYVSSAAPSPTAMSVSSNSPKNNSNRFVISLIVLVVILLGGATTYAYIQKIGPFGLSATYSEDNFLSGLLAKFAQINSASYVASGEISVVPRDGDAVPFVLDTSNSQDLAKQYLYDNERFKDVQSIVSILNRSIGYSSNIKTNSSNSATYPTNIKKLLSSAQVNSYTPVASMTDPETNNDYSYQVTDGGKNFALKITFDTNDAIKEVQSGYRYGYVSTSTIVEDKTITFTKDSSVYFYMPSEPPKPLIMQFGEATKMVPPDTDVKGAFSVSSQSLGDGTSNWLFNLDAEGSFGDLTYKINADAQKTDDMYYVRINNIPSLFPLGGLGIEKGKWISIPANMATSTTQDGYSELSIVKDNIPKAEEQYKENRDKFLKFIKLVATTADGQKLISFKNPPKAEIVDGKNLIRYDLSLKKDAILPFYNKLQEDMSNDPDLVEYKGMIDQGLVNYLQSQEFSDVFDYVNKNYDITFWTDAKGFPAILQLSVRVVPPDTATQLADKQIKIVFKVVLSDINKHLDIKAPTDSTPIDKIMKNVQGSLSDARQKGQTAAVQAKLASMRAQAEIIYDKSGNSYGKNPFPLGSCKKTVGTLFADDIMSRSLQGSDGQSMSSATCVSSGTVGNVISWAASAPIPGEDGFSYCVDSTGNLQKIVGALKGKSCR